MPHNCEAWLDPGRSFIEANDWQEKVAIGGSFSSSRVFVPWTSALME